MENINYNGLSERERGAWMGASKISKQTPCMIHLFPFPLFHFFTNDLPYNFLVFILIFHLVSSNYPTRGKREWVKACYTKDNTKQTHTRRTSPLFFLQLLFSAILVRFSWSNCWPKWTRKHKNYFSFSLRKAHTHSNCFFAKHNHKYTHHPPQSTDIQSIEWLFCFAASFSAAAHRWKPCSCSLATASIICSDWKNRIYTIKKSGTFNIIVLFLAVIFSSFFGGALVCVCVLFSNSLNRKSFAVLIEYSCYFGYRIEFGENWMSIQSAAYLRRKRSSSVKMSVRYSVDRTNIFQ